MVCEWMLVGWWLAKATYLTMLRIISKTMFSIFQHIYIYNISIYIYNMYIYIMYMYMYHLGFWTSCTVTVCNNHPKYSGSMFHPIHPSAAEELPAPHGASLHGRVAGAFAARSAAPSLRGELGTRRFDPWTKVVGSTKTSFYQQKGGEQIDKLGHLCEMIWWYEMSHLDQRKWCFASQIRESTNEKLSWHEQMRKLKHPEFGFNQHLAGWSHKKRGNH
jgi:hypothetical protein